MMAKVDLQGNVSVPEPVVLDASTTGTVSLPAGFPLSDAAFGRAGPDLVLTVPGHPPLVVRDFFAGDAPPALMTPDGARIAGDLAARMVGPSAPGQVASAELSVAQDAIGRVETVSGHAFVVRANGSREELAIGSRLHTGDVLETSADSAVGVVLADETSLSMGSDGRMVLDEMIYDPSTQEGSMSLSVLKGVYTIVSGMVSKTDPNAMIIDTPVGSIGIRGTQVGLEIPDGRNLNIVMMREEDGYVGEVFIRNEAGLQVMNQAHQVVFIGGVETPPTFMAPVDNFDIVRMFAPTLMHLPKASGRENDYSALTMERPEGATEGIEKFETQAGPAKPEGPAAPTETIRVVEGDYTKPREAVEGVTAPEPAAPPPAPAKPAEPVIATDRPDETIVTPPPAAPPANVAPEAAGMAFATREDEAIAGTLLATDADKDVLSFTLAGDGAPKHGTVTINRDGSYTYTPESDFSGVDSFTYLVSDGKGGTTTATATIEVAAVADVPVLSVSSAVGAEDSAIPLAIAATVPGKEEVASLIIAGVPKDATLSVGADNGDGTWTLAGNDLDQLGSLTLTPPADWSGDLALTVKATSTDGGVAEAGFNVAVAPVADLPVLTVSGASGAEDSAIPLAIAADVPGKEEVASVTIAGVPEGAALSAGTDNGDGTWTLAGDDLGKLGSLTLTPPADWSGDVALTVTATSTDGGVAAAGFNVAVAPVADVPVLTVSAASGAEDSAIPLAIAADVPGKEEVASVTIGGVPQGAMLSAGIDNGDGTWTLAGDDLGKLGSLTLTPPADWSGDVTLTVDATSTDGGTSSASLGVAVTPVPDVPVLTVSAAAGAEDAAIPLTITAAVPGNEELASVTIAGVPQGAMLSAGTDNGDGTWTLAGDDLGSLGSLTVTPPPNSSTDFSLSVTATSTDGGVSTASLGVTVAPVAEIPTLELEDVVVGGGGGPGEGMTIEGGEGADILYGGAGNDVIEGGEGADILYGDSGIAGAATVPIHVQVALSDIDPSESLGVTISGVPEGATLSSGTDLGDGSWSLAPDQLDGLEMTLPAGYQSDFDLQVAATVTDVDEDGGATDTSVATGTLSVAFTGETGGGDDQLYGGQGDDVLYGGAGNDVLEGGEGADVLHGETGDDQLYGGQGRDVLYGGAGDDVLEGGQGRDVLVGGAGDDVLRGGQGEDTFVFQAGAGKDIIADYEQGEQIRFEGPEFSQENVSVTQSGDAVKIAFGDQGTEVTVNDVDLSQQGYTVSQEGDAVVITFQEEHGH